MKIATLCYVRQDGQTLMIHRVKKLDDMHQGKWNGLGGKLEPGETPEECARREIFEESGLQVDQLMLKGLLTFPKFSKDEDWYAFVFNAYGVTGSLIESPEGDLKWIADEHLLELDLWEGDLFFIPWLDDAGFFSAKFTYRDGALVDHSAVFYS